MKTTMNILALITMALCLLNIIQSDDLRQSLGWVISIIWITNYLILNNKKE